MARTVAKVNVLGSRGCSFVRKRIRYPKAGPIRPTEEGSDSMAFWRRSPRQMQAATQQGAVGPAGPVAEKPKTPRARMMRQYDLVDRVKSYNPDTNEDLLNRAYVYAMKAHGTQTRASGDPYFSHPLEVAAILTGLKLDDATIVAALLHDTIEDTESTRAEIDHVFGHEIGALVEGLTKLNRLGPVSPLANQAENL